MLIAIKLRPHPFKVRRRYEESFAERTLARHRCEYRSFNNGEEYNERIAFTVRKLVDLLVDKKYAEIATWTEGRRLSEDQIGDAIVEYGRTVTELPDSTYSDLDVIEVENSYPRKWSVVFPVWTVEEGMSALSVEATFIDNDGEQLRVELDGIHAL